jgi:ryanodine receptor 2
MTYRPQPIDSSHVQLPAAISELIEKLAENSHDVWANGRLHDGWSLGPKRDDTLKQHPSLVPYGELSESEKEYDRRVVIATLQAIMALGYRISKAV